MCPFSNFKSQINISNKKIGAKAKDKATESANQPQ
jgi:hypothetical protein